MNQNSSNRRYVGKVRTTTAQNGKSFQNILIDNHEETNKDGTLNKYYKGNLIWGDVNGNNYIVKQLNIWVPEEGMPQTLLQKGFSCYITLDLENGFHVTLLK